jgi:putative flippase GtrA
VLGATVGAVVNFQLGRSWVFDARQGALWSQAIRYACVSLGCVVLNAIGMSLLARWMGSVSYVLHRVLVSCAVGVFFSYPAQRWLVFNVQSARPAQAPPAERLHGSVLADQSEQATSLPGADTHL